MKILQVSCEGLGTGGVQSIIMGIVKNITSIRFDIILFTNEKRFYEDEFISCGGTIFRIPNYRKQFFIRKLINYGARIFRIFLCTYRIIKQNGPYEIIHCHNGYESGICLLAAYCAGVKIRISHSHRTDYDNRVQGILHIFQNGYISLLQILMLRFSNIKIACSQKAAHSLYGPSCLIRKDLLIMPNGVDLKKFSIGKCKKNRSKEFINIIHVGQYCANKNQLFIIELIPFLKEYFDEFEVKLIGFNDEYKQILIERCTSLAIDDYVEFFNENSDIAELLRQGDIFIFPSIKEGFGIALLEAQAIGLLCIVSDTVDPEVDLGLCKFLSLEEPKKKWAETIAKMIGNKEQYHLDHIKLESFSMLNYAKQFEDIYGKGMKCE